MSYVYGLPLLVTNLAVEGVVSLLFGGLVVMLPLPVLLLLLLRLLPSAIKIWQEPGWWLSPPVENDLWTLD